MTIKQQIIAKESDKILELIDNNVKDEVSRGDLQGITEAIINSALYDYRIFVIDELAKILKGIEADTFTADNIHDLIVKLDK